MKKIKKVFKDWFKAIFIALILALVFRVFMFQSYSISGTSMEKTLCTGDFIVVNKINFGARFPITLLSLPFFDDVYTELIQIPYLRFFGFNDIENNDIIVYNYPKLSDVPIDKKEKRIGRCIALPGDTLKINHKIAYINDNNIDTTSSIQFAYRVTTDGNPVSQEILNKYKINEGVIVANVGIYDFFLTQKVANSLLNEPNVKYVRKLEDYFNLKVTEIFPGHVWNKDFFGPVIIPQKGVSVKLNNKNLNLYKRIIELYEENSLIVQNNKIIINGTKTDTYTFKMDYYFILDDNRDNSKDSRKWGFLPENHIIGTASFIWFSINKNENDIRWNRIGQVI